MCSGLETTTVEESCAQQFLTCGDVVVGTTQNYHDMVGSASPDALYVLVAFDATRMAITTCNDVTSFDTVLYVFDGAPSHANTTLLAESDSTQACGTVFFDAPAAGSATMRASSWPRSPAASCAPWTAASRTRAG